MPNPMLAVAGIGAGSSLIGASKQASAASDASAAQIKAAEMGIAEQRRQFDAVRELLAPFAEGGTDAMREMSALAGVSGSEAQAEALQRIQDSPQLATAIQMGEEALLQNAAATGGLRGGNTQAALAQMRPQMFSQMIDQRYSQLGGLAGMGQASAAGQAAAAQNLGSNVSSLMAQQGAAAAGGALASGQAWQQGLSGIGSAAGFIGSQMPSMPEGATIFSRWGF